MKRESYRANNPVAVWDRISETQFEDTVHSGTARPVQRGRCYHGDDSGYVRLPNVSIFDRDNFKFDFYFSVANFNRQDLFANWGTRGIIIRIDVNGRIGTTFTNGSNLSAVAYDLTINTVYRAVLSRYGAFIQYEIYQGNERVFFRNFSGVTASIAADGTLANIGAILSGLNPLETGSFIFDFKYYELDNLGNEVSLLAHYKCDERSGATAYDSSGNGNHGAITDAVTVPFEENPESIHQFQDIFSWQNEVGYSSVATVFPSPSSTDIIFTLNNGVLITSTRDSFVIQRDNQTFTANYNWRFFPNTGGDFGYSNGDRVRVRFEIRYTYNLVRTLRTALNNGGGTDASDRFAIVTNTPNVWIQVDTILTVSRASTPQFAGLSILMSYVGSTPVSDHFLELRNISVVNPIDRLIPRDESVQLPPFQDVLGNVLQFSGHVPYNADLVNSPCLGAESNHVSLYENVIPLDFQLQNFEVFFSFKKPTYQLSREYIRVGTDAQVGWNARMQNNNSQIRFNFRLSNGTNQGFFPPLNQSFGAPEDVVSRCYFRKVGANLIGTELNTGASQLHTLTDSTIVYTHATSSFLLVRLARVNADFWGVRLNELDADGNFVRTVLDMPMNEPVVDFTNHTYFDKSGNGHHGTLIDGSVLATRGRQNDFHDLMVNGFGRLNQINPFDPRDEYVDYRFTPINLGTTFSFEYQALSISADINQFVIHFLGSIVGSTVSSGFGLWVFGGLRAAFDNNLAQAQAIYRGNLDGQLHTFRIDYDTTQPTIQQAIRIYRDGIELTPSSYNGNNYAFFQNQEFQINRLRLVAFPNRTSILGRTRILDGNGVAIIDIPDFSTGEDILGAIQNRVDIGDQTPSVVSTIFVPKHATNNTDALGNPLTSPQDGSTFLNCRTELQVPRAPAIIQADVGTGAFTLSDGTPRQLSFWQLNYQQFLDNKYFVGNTQVDAGRLTPVVFHKEPLVRRQLSTEILVRNAEAVSDNPGVTFRINRQPMTIAATGVVTYEVDGQSYSSNNLVSAGYVYEGEGAGLIISPDNFATLTSMSFDNAGVEGRLDISAMVNLVSFVVRNNQDLVDLVLPENISPTTFTMQGIGTSGVLDMSSWVFVDSAGTVTISATEYEEIRFPSTVQAKRGAISISSHPNVRVGMDLSGFESVTSIVVATCPLLESLSLPNNTNPLTTVDLSGLGSVGNLDLRGMTNIVGALSLNNALGLTSVQMPATLPISSIDIGGTGITSIDLSGANLCTSFSADAARSLQALILPTVNTAVISRLFFRNNNALTGHIDMSGFTNLAGLVVFNTTLVTGYTFPTSTGTVTQLVLGHNPAATITEIDVSTVTVNGLMSITNAQNLTTLTLGLTNKAFPIGLTLTGLGPGSRIPLDLRPVGNLGRTLNIGTSQFTSVILPDNTGDEVVDFTCSSCNFLTTIDMRAIVAMDRFNADFCRLLTTLEFPVINTPFEEIRVRSCTGLTTLDCSNLARLSHLFASGANNLINLTLPASTETWTTFDLNSTSVGYIDLTGLTGLLAGRITINLLNMRLTAEDVNHYLVDLDSISALGVSGRIISIGGNNAAPDGTSGGFPGLLAIANLEAKGITVNRTT